MFNKTLKTSDDIAVIILVSGIVLFFVTLVVGAAMRDHSQLQLELEKIKLQEMQVQAGVKLCRTSTAP